MIDIHKYLERQYSPQPCWELVADVYATEFNAIAVDYKTVNRSIREMAGAFRLAIHKSPHGFAKVDAPIDGCIVLMGKTSAMGVHHCGIFYDNKVLHAQPDGNFYEYLWAIQDRYELVEFWAK